MQANIQQCNRRAASLLGRGASGEQRNGIGDVLLSFGENLGGALRCLDRERSSLVTAKHVLVASPNQSLSLMASNVFRDLFGEGLDRIRIPIRASPTGYPSPKDICQSGALLLVSSFTRYEWESDTFTRWARTPEVRHALRDVPTLVFIAIPQSEIVTIDTPFKMHRIEAFGAIEPIVVPFVLGHLRDEGAGGELAIRAAQREIAAALCIGALRRTSVDLPMLVQSLDREVAQSVARRARTISERATAQVIPCLRASIGLGEFLKCRRLALLAAEAVDLAHLDAELLAAAAAPEVIIPPAARRVIAEVNDLRRNVLSFGTARSRCSSEPFAPLREFRKRGGEFLAALLADLPQSAAEKREGFEKVAALLADEFPVVVAGEFSAGKSTLINTILLLSGAAADDTLPTGPGATTAVPTVLRRGAPSVYVRLSPSRDLKFFERYLGDEDRFEPVRKHIDAYCAWLEAGVIDPRSGYSEVFGTKERAKLPNHSSARSLQKWAAEESVRAQQQQYRGVLAKDLARAKMPRKAISVTFRDAKLVRWEDSLAVAEDSAVALRAESVEVYRPLECLEGICLIDTPGTGSASHSHAVAVARFLERVRTGLIVYVLSADRPENADDKMGLERILGTRGKDAPIFFLVNVTGRHEPEQIEELRAELPVWLGSILGYTPKVAFVNVKKARSCPDSLDWPSFEDDLRRFVLERSVGELGRYFHSGVRDQLEAIRDAAKATGAQASNGTARLQQLLDRETAISSTILDIRRARLGAAPIEEMSIAGRGCLGDIVRRAVNDLPVPSWFAFGDGDRDRCLSSVAAVVRDFDGIVPILASALQRVLDTIHSSCFERACAIPGRGIYVERRIVSKTFEPFHYHQLYSESLYTEKPRFGWHKMAIGRLVERVKRVLYQENARATEAAKSEVDQYYADILVAFEAARGECRRERKELLSKGGPEALSARSESWSLFVTKWLSELDSFDVEV